jgi:AraC-like DNA-binding protein
MEWAVEISSKREDGRGDAMEKIAFSSDDLPLDLDEQTRLSVWRDFLSGVCGSLEVSCLPDRPFSQRMERARFDGVNVVRLRGTMDRIGWTPTNATRSPDFFFLCLNRTPMSLSQLGRKAECESDTAVLGSCAERGDIRWKGCNDLSLIIVPQARLRELVTGAGDLVARPLQCCNTALRHLRRYLDILPVPDQIADNPDLTAHIGRALTDLVALVLGAEGDAAAIACMRGPRAARLREVVAEIRAGFADPAFSAQHLARKLGVSARYIQDLLQETGSAFTARVLELRLQRARAMLTDPRHDRMKVGEIAAACGFNEIPHFNRCFRRRFGTTPTRYRGGSMC